MKKRILSVGALAITAALVSSVVAQTVTGKPEDNKLTPATGTFYVNVPPDPIPPNNLNNSNTKSLGIAIASNGNMIIGWEDDGDALTDFEAVWTLYDRNGTSISPNVLPFGAA